MASEAILARLQAEFDSPADAIRAVVDLLEDGAPPQFISRYRREQTGDLADERVAEIAERTAFLQEIETRKAAILAQAEEQGKLTDELRDAVQRSFDQDFIDDVYQSFRPRRRTPALVAEEKGVGPLALAIHHRTLGDQSPLEAAAPYVDPSRDLPSPETVLEQVVLILSERYGSDPEVRSRVRNELSRGILRAEVVAPEKKGADRYQQLFTLAEPVRRIPPSRMLSLRRAEWEGILKLHLHLPDGRALEIMRERFAPEVDRDSPLGQLLDFVFDHSYKHHVWPACEADVRRRLKEKADRDTVRTLARSYRSQLLAPPLGSKKALGVRTSGKAAWLVALNEDGSLLEKTTVQADDDAKLAEAVDVLADLLRRTEVAAVAIPHGRRQERSQTLIQRAVAKLEPGKRPMVVPVDERASAIWATSVSGRKAMPDADVGVRTATSLARRLQDPMAELLQMDLRTIGFGPSLDDVHQRLLRTEMDAVVAACVARVGVDLNTADASQLAKVPGLTPELAKAIADHRKANGPFRTRQALADVAGIDERTLRHVVGFLRVVGGDQPLDATDLHPEHYGLAEQIAAKEGKPIGELCGRDLSWLPLREWLDGGTPRRVLKDVVDAMAGAGADPRGVLTPGSAHELRALTDLKPGMEIEGRVTNLTEFGAFVDVGVGTDGLIHISQIPKERLQDGERMLRVGEVLRCYVARVEPEKNRIGLSLFRPRGDDRPHGERGDRRPRGRRGDDRSRGPRDGDRRDGDRRGGGGGGRFGPRRSGPPRVITIESEREREEVRGFKGELRSLAGLKDLLAKQAPRPGADEP